MKIVKAELEDGMHAKFKTWAFSRGVTMADALKGFVVEVVSGLRAGGTDGDAQRVGSIPKPKTDKSVSITDSESKAPAPSLHKHQWIIRNGHSECQFCGERPEK